MGKSAYRSRSFKNSAKRLRKDFMPVLKKIISQCFTALQLACSTIFFSAQTQVAREYQIKAVFLFNFAQFVEWPATSFKETDAIIIGVLGENPFGTYLEEAVRGEKVNGHPLVVQRYRQVDEVKTCHILFINAPETHQLKEVFASLK